MTESLFPQKRMGLPEVLAPLRGGALWLMGIFCFGVRNLWESNAMLFS